MTTNGMNMAEKYILQSFIFFTNYDYNWFNFSQNKNNKKT